MAMDLCFSIDNSVEYYAQLLNCIINEWKNVKGIKSKEIGYLDVLFMHAFSSGKLSMFEMQYLETGDSLKS